MKPCPGRVDSAPRSRRPLLVGYGSVLLAAVICVGVLHPFDADIWLWLTIGRWTWAHGGPPTVDVFSYPMEGKPFMAHSWLFALLLYGIERHAGSVGFLGLQLALVSVALGCTWRVGVRLKAPAGVMILLSPLVLTVLWGRLELRAALFSSACLAVEWCLLVSVHTGQRSWYWLWGLPPLFVLWVNGHGGWPQGMALLGVTWLGVVAMAVRRRWLGRGEVSPLCPWRLGVVLAVSGVALRLNPYGGALVWFPSQMQASWIRARIAEWQSPFSREGWGQVAGGVAVPWLIQAAFVAYLLVLLVVLVRETRRWRTADLVRLGVMAFWAAFGVWHLRAVVDAVLQTAPLVAASGSSVAWTRRSWPVWWGSGMALGLGLVAFTTTTLPIWRGEWRWNRHEPICVYAALAGLVERHRSSGTLDDAARESPLRVASDTLSARLLYRFHPQVQMDGSWDFVHGEAWRLAMERRRRQGLGALLGQAEQWQVDVLVLRARWGPRLAEFEAWGWRLVSVEAHYFVLARAGATDRPPYRLIQNWGQEGSRPHWSVGVTRANATQVLAEAERLLDACPTNALAAVYQANALRRLGREGEAEAVARQHPAVVR
jgi:hypothetical protein